MIVDVAAYRDGKRVPGDLSVDDAYERSRDDGTFVWLGLHEPTRDEIDRVGAEFGIHELAAEDAVHARQRPKLERYEDATLIVVKPARYDDEAERIDLGEILVFVGDRFVVPIRHGQAAPLVDVRRDLETRPDLLQLGPSAVVYAILDRVVDDYAPVVAGLEQDIEEVEAEVFSDSRENPIERIYFLKREVLAFHRAAAPLREPLQRLADGDLPWVHEDGAEYFRDVHDHLTRLVERAETMRELLTGLLEAALTQIGIQQNEDMRRISAWVAIVAVPTFITSAYGMNLAQLPGDDLRQGFAILVAVMAVIALALWVLFRRRGWI